METQIHKIKYLGKDEKITQFLSESDEQFQEKIKLIKKLESEKVEWKNALKISKVYCNVKFKKCKYPPMVYNMVKKYL